MALSFFDLLSRVSLFERAAPLAIHRFAEIVTLREFHKGEILFKQGEEASTFYLLQSGWIKVKREKDATSNVLVDILGSGDLVGTVAVVNRHRYPATAMTVTNGDIFQAKGQDFLALMNEFPDIRDGYMRVVGDRLRHALYAQTENAIVLEARMAKLLLRLGERMGKVEQATIVLPRIFTRQDIADLLGTTVETVIRTLSKWKKSGLVVEDEEKFVLRLDSLTTESTKVPT